MFLFVDTEFMEDGCTIELLSIGVVDEQGRQLYAENADADLSRANDFVKRNVLPGLVGGHYRMPAGKIRDALYEFAFRACGDRCPLRCVADHGAYDWVAVCQLFGRMIDLPPFFPKYIIDLKQLLEEHVLWYTFEVAEHFRPGMHAAVPGAPTALGRVFVDGCVPKDHLPSSVPSMHTVHDVDLPPKDIAEKVGASEHNALIDALVGMAVYKGAQEIVARRQWESA